MSLKLHLPVNFWKAHCTRSCIKKTQKETKKRNTSQNKHFYKNSSSIFELKTLIDRLQIIQNHPMKPNNCNTIAIEQQLKNDEKL